MRHHHEMGLAFKGVRTLLAALLASLAGGVFAGKILALNRFQGQGFDR